MVVQYDAADRACRECLLSLDCAESRDFAGLHLRKVVELFLAQDPINMQLVNQRHTDSIVASSVDIFLGLPVEMQRDNLAILDALFCYDPSAKYYNTYRKTYMGFEYGFPQVRKQAVGRFASECGFEMLLRLLQEEEYGSAEAATGGGGATASSALKTVSLELLANILRAMSEVCDMVEAKTRSDLLGVMFDRFLSETDEQLKKDRALDAVPRVLSALKKLSSNGEEDRFYEFWISFTARLMNSGTLVLRLFAWDQVNLIIRDAVSKKPLAQAYEVKNAGNLCVNGIYKRLVDGWPGKAPYDKDCGLYQRAPVADGEPELSLFRCGMSSGQKWWFISKADYNAPGGKKDVDYYQNSVQAADYAKEPPLSGWLLSPTHGHEPPPTLLRIPAELDPAIKTSTQKVTDWALQTKLLEHAFGLSSIKSEIVSRSHNLLRLLVECDAVTGEHLRWIWKSAIHNQDIVITESVFAVLSSITGLLNDELFAALVEAALDSLALDPSATTVAKLSLFLEKIATEIDPYFCTYYISEPSSDKLLSLVWAVCQSSHFDSLKNATVVQDLLSKCLSRDVGGRMTIHHVRECLAALSDFGTTAKKVDEGVVGRVILTLQFLVTKQTGFDVTLETVMDHFPDGIFEELKRFTSVNRPKVVSGKIEQCWFNSQLAVRLQLLRQFYGLKIGVKMPLKLVSSLWDMLSKDSNDLDLLLEFFMKGVVHHEQLASIFESRDHIAVFNDYVCSSAIDWASCSCTAFECFTAFFSNDFSRNFSGRFDPQFEKSRDLGVQTLWRITLSIISPEATVKAMNLLLKYYDDATTLSAGNMMELAFAHLQENLVISTPGSDFDHTCKTRVSRCVDLLSTAISRVDSGSQLLSHAICGTMSRISVVVHYKKVRQYATTTTTTTYYSSSPVVVERSEGSTTLQVHPLMSIAQLKEIICKVASFPDSNNVTLENSAKALSSAASSSRLQDHGLVDGSEVHAVYTIKTYNSNYPRHLDMQSTTNVGESISRNEAQFRCLLNLCDVIVDADVRKKIWNLLMIVPTNDDMVATLKDSYDEFLSGDPDVKRIDWKILFGSSTSNIAYMLQVADHMMKPSCELDGVAHEYAVRAKRAFLMSGGFPFLLHILSTIQSAEDDIQRAALYTSLHMIHYLLFDADEVFIPPEQLFHELEASSSTIVDKLLSVASDAAYLETSDVVHEAFNVLSHLLKKSASATAQLTANPQSKSLLAFCLRSASLNVRKISSDFAVFIGHSQPVVFKWLLGEIEHVDIRDTFCHDTFRALCELLQEHVKPDVAYVSELANLLSCKILAFPAQAAGQSLNEVSESQALLGYLTLLEVLVSDYFDLIAATELGQQLVEKILDDFLFALPSASDDTRAPICNMMSTRSRAFGVLLAYVKWSPKSLVEVLRRISQLKLEGAQHIELLWSQQVSHDVKKSSVKYSGLKNQGCTCYINSLLQQLYLCTGFREAILSAPLRQEHRHTISHLKPEELVGKMLIIGSVVSDAKETRLIVKSFDPDTYQHEVQVDKGTIKCDLMKEFRSANSVRVVPIDATEELLYPKNAAALMVLEQLQRTFCHMQFSNKRFFDPVLFVESCKTLNMNFPVYQQNDAAEFFNALLDRVETGTKGADTSIDVWNEIFLKNVFGATVGYQKTPKMCELYQTNKNECGHGAAFSAEHALAIELQITGMDKIEESLSHYFTPELMEGDNAVNCDTCKQKKDTTRRAVLSRLPNLLVLHLKRFQLDYESFEVVKLNSRMEFPSQINMLKYTKEGVEWEERKRTEAEQDADTETSRDGSSSPLTPRRAAAKLQHEASDPDAPNSDDYDYELQGVLVHSGIAQGGHYYSFARDPDNKERWYRLDDEEVTLFNPENTALQCFGGPASSASGAYSTVSEDERTANALLLFYSKVKTANLSVSSSFRDVGDLKEKAASQPELRLVDGYDAFKTEVRLSNLQHTMLKYLFDEGLHLFVRDLLDSAPADPELIQFLCEFFVDVVLHFRERTKKDCRAWLSIIRQGFNRDPFSAQRFLACDKFEVWRKIYHFQCNDATARRFFNDLHVLALTSLVQSAQSNLISQEAVGNVIVMQIKQLQSAILEKFVSEHKFFDEAVVMIRDMTRIPQLRLALIENQFITILAFFLDPSAAEEPLRKHLHEIGHTNLGLRLDYIYVAAAIYEAIAAMLGVGSIRKVPLLVEPPKYGYNTTNWDNTADLTDDAKDAFATIFSENCSNGNSVMTKDDVAAYSSKVSHKDAVAELLRKQLTIDGCLQLEGFIAFQIERLERAAWNDKPDVRSLWAELLYSGFRNDLSRDAGDFFTKESEEVLEKVGVLLKKMPMKGFSSFSLYEYGIQISDQSAFAMAKFICEKVGIEHSLKLISKALDKLYRNVNSDGVYQTTNLQNSLMSFILSICSINDEHKYARVHEAFLNETFGLANVVYSQL